VEAEDLEKYGTGALKGADGIIVPGGFGDRGIEGKILAAEYARKNNVPYLGICLGMQTAVIEFARNVLGLKDANSGEFARGEHSVIDLMPDQKGNIPKGGTMRLGAYPCDITEGTLMEKAYGTREIRERHRHRYEFNNSFREEMQKAGLVIAGTSPDGRLVEAVENPNCTFFVGVQYHPEFKSRPNHAHPLFRDFIAASCKGEK
jgi:CTP synthase